jgi:hypothetical protein
VGAYGETGGTITDITADKMRIEIFLLNLIIII